MDFRSGFRLPHKDDAEVLYERGSATGEPREQVAVRKTVRAAKEMLV